MILFYLPTGTETKVYCINIKLPSCVNEVMICEWNTYPVTEYVDDSLSEYNWNKYPREWEKSR